MTKAPTIKLSPSVASKNQLTSFVGYCGFAIFDIALLTSTERTYHIDIYATVPTWGWAAFALALCCGVLLAYSAAQTRSKRVGVHAVVILGCSFGVFWFLGRFLGLSFWTATRGDVLGHFARAKAILSAGAISPGDVYPPLHVLLAIVVSVTNLSVSNFTLLSIVTYPILVVGVVLCVRRMSSPQVAGYVAVAAIPLWYVKYTHNLFPWMTFFALIPYAVLLLWILQFETSFKQRAWITTSVIGLLIAIALGHPMSGGVAVITIALIGVIQRFDAWCSHDHDSRSTAIRLTVLLPALVSYPAWYLSQISFREFLATIVVSLLTGASSSAAAKLGRAGTSGYTLQQLLTQYLVYRWGVALLLLSTAGLVALPITYRVLRRRAGTNEVVLLALFVAGGGLGVILLLGNFIANNIYRVNQLTIAVAIVLVGVGLWWTSEHAEGRAQLLRYGLLTVIVAGVVTTPFMIYDDQHLTETEIDGMSYYVRTADQSQTLYQDDISIVFVSYILESTGATHGGVRTSLRPMPKHLGYPENKTFAATIGRNEFNIITKKRDEVWINTQPPNRRPYVNYYTARDTQRLADDPSVSRVYSNGGFSIWSA